MPSISYHRVKGSILEIYNSSEKTKQRVNRKLNPETNPTEGDPKDHGCVVNMRGCWIPSLKHDEGLQVISMRGVIKPAHRVAYAIHTGVELDRKMMLLHRCGDKDCVNPAHFTVTPQKRTSSPQSVTSNESSS